jgi:hypothetical protein
LLAKYDLLVFKNGILFNTLSETLSISGTKVLFSFSYDGPAASPDQYQFFYSKQYPLTLQARVL